MDSNELSPMNGKRKRWLGLTALCLILAAILFIAAVGAYAFLAYRNGTLDGTILPLLTVAVIVTAVMAGLCLLLSIITFFRKGQKKGLAVLSLILALFVLLGCVGVVYAYQYVFSSMAHDAAFDDLSREELGIVEIGKAGEVLRDLQEALPEVSAEKVREMQSVELVEFEHLTNDDLPEDARTMLEGQKPNGPSYLMGDHDQITNFLLMGLDNGDSADSIIIFSLDRVHQKLKMISVARDSYLLIPDFGVPAKLAYTNNWGGAKLTAKTLNTNFSLNIQDYIAVDMGQLADIVDSLDGIELELTQEDANFLNNHPSLGRTFYPGRRILHGNEVTCYARNRSDSEANRTGRQRNVLNSILLEVRKMPVSAYPNFIRTCLSLCTTSIGTEDLLGMAMEVAQKDYSIESYALVENVDFWGGILGKEQYFYVVYDPKQASDWIYRTIYEDLYKSGYQN